MRYIIRSCYVENTHEEAIAPELFNIIRNSRRVLTAALEIEEIFDNLVSNYLEIESKCFALTARSLVRRVAGYREGNEALASINLVFVNYLSTARAYVDKIGRAAARCLPELATIDAKASVSRLLAEQYDAEFGYRFMEALRNHVQHSGSALHVLSPGTQHMRSEDESRRSRELFLNPLCSKERLIERGSFKAQVLNESPDTVNLLESARAHLRGLSRVQRAVRALVENAAINAADQIKRAQAMLEGKVSSSLDATEAVLLSENDDVQERVPLLLQWDNVRLWLTQRNSGIGDGVQTFPSGRS
ncbi:hypothetical protein [Ottowia sp. VDI28]|uniref:hypothetical protein n=1 Tax=Ottowia sp. VDI28 TaxID=3133968 RepID=UPI003C2EA3C7